MTNNNNTIDFVRDSILSTKLIPNKNVWPEVNLDKDVRFYDGDLTSGMEGTAFDFVRSVSSNSIFPVSGVMLTAMGAIACLSARKMTTMPFIGGSDTRPLNLYVTVAAGTSSGKSMVYKKIFGCTFKQIAAIEIKKEKERARINYEIDSNREEIKMLKKANPDSNHKENPAIKSLNEEISNLMDELKANGMMYWNLCQSNPQAAAVAAKSQDGYLPIHGAENELMDFVSGNSAGIKTGIFRNGFDGEPFNYGKQGENGKGMITMPKVTTSICSLGQENVIDIMLRGSNIGIEAVSNGFFERFLVLELRAMAGRKREFTRGPAATSEQEEYWKKICYNLISMKDEMSLVFSDESKKLFEAEMLNYDDHCVDGGAFSRDPMVGMVGKAVSHLSNIAGVLHIMKEFGVLVKPGAPLNSNVAHETVKQAVSLFRKILQAHTVILKKRGLVGVDDRSSAVMEAIVSKVEKDKTLVLSNTAVQRMCASRAIFKKPGAKKLTSAELMTSIYPDLEGNGMICVVGKTVYINPNLI